MLHREDKEKLVASLRERFARQRVSLFADIRGISVAKLSAFRRELAHIGAGVKGTKKTLLKRALQAAGISVEPRELEGELGVIFGYEDLVAPAKLAAKFARENDTFKVRKGLLEGKILELAEVQTLATLPSRDTLLAMLARVLMAPIRGLAMALEGNIRNLAVVLIEIKDKKV